MSTARSKSPPDISAYQALSKASVAASSVDHSEERGDVEDEKVPAKRKAISRVGRACKGCRRLKMRCEEADDPPCRRCRRSGAPCVFDGPVQRDQFGGETGGGRLDNLEAEIGNIRNTLNELVTSLKATPSASLGPSASDPDLPKREVEAAQALTFSHNSDAARPLPIPSRSPFASWSAASASNGINFPQQRDNSPSSTRQPQFPPLGFGATEGVFAVPNVSVPGNTQVHPINLPPIASLPYSRPESLERLPLLNPQLGHDQTYPQFHVQSPSHLSVNLSPLVHSNKSSSVKTNHRTTLVSNVTSADPSDDEEDLPSSGLTAPLEVLRSMAEKEEEADKVVDPSPGSESTGRSFPGSASRSFKRRKLEDRRSTPHVTPDVVHKGLVSEQEVRELFDIFYSGCSWFLPIFDRNVDTFDDLHNRSPFSVDAICMVAAKVRDAGGEPSQTQLKCSEEVRMISSHTLFVPVARREAVQAMILVAGWSLNGWLTGGHAIRMALEIGIDKAWSRLSSRMRSGTRSLASADEHDLVTCTRIWFCLYLFEHQISLGTGRRALLSEEVSVHDSRLFLQHPLSVESDLRLVSTVELMTIRDRFHNQLAAASEDPIGPKIFQLIEEGEKEFAQWFSFWDQCLSLRYDGGSFYRRSLLIQRLLSELFHNALALRRIRGPEDVARMPSEQFELAKQSIDKAQQALDICIRSPSYRDGLKYAPDYTHVTATFAASFLIRLARLFPTAADLAAIYADVAELAKILSQVPATRYSQTLQSMLRNAQGRLVRPSQAAAPTTQSATVGVPSHDSETSGLSSSIGEHADSNIFSGSAQEIEAISAIYQDGSLLFGDTSYDFYQIGGELEPVISPGFGYGAFVMPADSTQWPVVW